MSIDYFPLDVAANKAFCNRVSERQRIVSNIKMLKHTLITAPRRFGKTSLSLQSINDSKVIGHKVDLMLSTDAIGTRNIILKGIGDLVVKVSKGKRKVLALAKQLFSDFTFDISVNLSSIRANIKLKEPLMPQIAITKSLEQLDNLLGKLGVTAVLFMDEFQQIGTIHDHYVIEASIRSQAQVSKNLVFIFSGSNRQMLLNMFDDKSRPLYNMCDHIVLDRIHELDYYKYIQKVAKARWGGVLVDDIIDSIFYYSQRHSYYLNVLCSSLWRLRAAPKLVSQVEDAWLDYVNKQEYRVYKEILQLSAVQRTILALLSIEPFSQPTSKNVLLNIRASSTGASVATSSLLERDWIYKDSRGFFNILDPVVANIIGRDARTIIEVY